MLGVTSTEENGNSIVEMESEEWSTDDLAAVDDLLSEVLDGTQIKPSNREKNNAFDMADAFSGTYGIDMNRSKSMHLGA